MAEDEELGVRGFLTLHHRARDRDLAGGAVAEVAALYVHPERWRGGTGAALLDAAVTGAAAAGARALVLWVLAGNEGARAFYADRGLRSDGWSRGAYGVEEVRLRLGRLRGVPVLAAAPDDVREELRSLVPEVEVVGLDERREEVTFLVPASAVTRDLEGWPALEAVQTLSAGTDWLDGRVPDGVTLCNARGARDQVVAEWTVAALLGLTSGLLRAAHDTTWSPYDLEELGEQEVLVLGAGSIARAVRDRLTPLGTRVRLTGREAREDVEATADALADLDGIDHLVVLLPGGAATAGLVDAAVLGRLRDGAGVVNVGRGTVVDTDALTSELTAGRLRGVLDVVDPEPLPDDHPLWRAPGLLALSSHSAGDSPQADRRALELVAAQLRRHAAGQRLENVVAPG